MINKWTIRKLLHEYANGGIMVEEHQRRLKPVVWMGSSRRDLREFPEDVKDVMGHALLMAQLGGKHVAAKVLQGFGGASVLEVVDDHEGGTYRAVYTGRFREIVYVPHAFQKKSKTCRKT